MRALLTAISLLVLTGLTPVSADETPTPDLSTQPWQLRPSDDLLQRPDLQQVVEAQNKRDANAIGRFLESSDPIIRARAAFAAGSLQAPSLLPTLTTLLDDPDPKVRVDAAFALRQTPGANPAVLLEHLHKESDPTAQSMLLGALGFQGDQASYEKVLKLQLPRQEVPTILCLIYYLQRDIVTPAGIEAMVSRLHKDNSPTIREHAAYFFYTLKRRQIKEPKLAEQLAAIIEASSFDDPAAPYLMRYLASCKRPQDLGLFEQWLNKGDSIRARSVAVESIGAFTDQQSARKLLLKVITDPTVQVAMAAAEILSLSTDLTSDDVVTIKSHLTAKRANPSTRSFLWSILWKHGDQAYLEEVIATIPPTDGTLLFTALNAAPGIDFDEISKQIASATTHPNPQVNLLTGNYLAERVVKDPTPGDLKAFDHFLSNVRDKKVRGEALFELALSLQDHLPAADRAKRFNSYHQKFIKEGDLPSAGACLIILGSTREPSSSATLNNALKHPSPIIRAAAAGGQELLKNGTNKPINHYILDFVPFLDPHWELLKKFGRHPLMTFHTRLGEIVIQLDAEQAPVGTANLIKHIQNGTFNKLHVYRLVPNHVIQAGPPGNFGYRIRSEFTRIPKVEHSFGIGDFGKDTASQHIAITHLMRPHNEGKYTKLGLVIKGRDIVKRVRFNELISKTTIQPDPNRKAVER